MDRRDLYNIAKASEIGKLFLNTTDTIECIHPMYLEKIHKLDALRAKARFYLLKEKEKDFFDFVWKKAISQLGSNVDYCIRGYEKHLPYMGQENWQVVEWK